MIFRSKYFSHFYVFVNRKVMKTIGINFVICVLFSLSLPAQTKQEFKPDPFKIGFDSFQHNFGDTLKTGNAFGANDLQFPFQKDKFPRQNQNFARNGSNKQMHSDSHFRMPVFKPEFQSNMPVLKPDSSVHYHLLIYKIEK